MNEFYILDSKRDVKSTLQVEPGAIWHPLGMPSNHMALRALRILGTAFGTSHLSTALCSFTLLLKVTI